MAITKATASSIAPAVKGDLVAGSATNDAAVLTVGANGTLLTADSTEATGLKWAAAASGGANWSLLNSGGTALTGAQTVTVSGISGKDKIMILIDSASSASASSFIQVRLNGDTGSNYTYNGTELVFGSTYNSANFGMKNTTSTSIDIARMATSAGEAVAGYVLLSGCNSSGVKQFNSNGGGGGGDGQRFYNVAGFYNSATVISSISIVSSVGNLDAGTVYVYTSA